MFTFSILTAGATKDPLIKGLQDKYIRYSKPFAKIETLSVKTTPFNSINERERVTKIEAELLLARTPKNTKIILLTEHGKTFTSENFSKQLLTWSEHESIHLTFIVAGPLGIHPSLQKVATAELSLSPMTMPHELALIVLLEQLYRATTILKQKTYHY